MQEAADLVTSAADQEVNVIFGSVINENLNDEIVVTVIATGFDENAQPKADTRQKQQRPNIGQTQQAATQQTSESTPVAERESSNPSPSKPRPEEDELDIPTFLRNRNRNR